MLNQDYKEILSLFIKNDVEFMIIGAYALAYYGFPRSTGDIDLFVRPTIDNSMKIHASLAEFGAPIVDLPTDYFSIPGHYFQIGVAPCRIDILNDIDGISYGAARFEWASVDGLSFKVISKVDFITNKKASGRPKDLADVAYLQ